MRILYIFPHPDDESFGPACAMSRQKRDGHEVYLLTLTKGGATKQRHKYGYSVDEMGEVRAKEMECVEDVLKLDGMTILDFPDSGLKHVDPRELEVAIEKEIMSVEPEVVVTYAVHGISGFHDHLISHAVVKRAFVDLISRAPFLKRLALFTISEDMAKVSDHFSLSHSTAEEIDCVVPVDDIDVARANRALDCYETFQETIEKSGVRRTLGPNVYFEIFGERHDPPLKDLFEGI